MEYNNWYIGVRNKNNKIRFSVVEKGLENIFTELKQYWDIYIVQITDKENWSDKIIRYNKQKGEVYSESNTYKLNEPYNELQLNNLNCYFSETMEYDSTK